MNKLLPSNRIYISESKIQNAGRGVFARVDIKKGEIIERCPVIEIQEGSSLKEGILITYVYFFGKNKERFVVALGFGSIYNHTYQPNARYEEKHKEKAIDFIAIQEIKKNEEITVNYSQGNQNNNSPLWFEAASL